MSETLEVPPAAEAPVLPGAGDGASTATGVTGPIGVTGPVGATGDPTPAESEDKKEKKPTEYVVLISNAEEGPYTKVGVFPGFGQDAAKKGAGEKLITDGAENLADLFFTAIPTTSWSPKKPAGVKLEPQITF